MGGWTVKRIINVTATYNLDDPDLVGADIPPKEKVEERVTEQMIDIFGWDEGYEDLEIEVVDIP